MNWRSIAIAGCGPCGLASALLLARAGHDVKVFERFSKPRPIGSGLMIQPMGLAVLMRLGLAEQIMREGARIDRLHGVAGSRVVLSVGYEALKARPAMFGIGIHRASLFAILYDAMLAEGVELRTGYNFSGSAMHGAQRCLQSPHLKAVSIRSSSPTTCCRHSRRSSSSRRNFRGNNLPGANSQLATLMCDKHLIASLRSKGSATRSIALTALMYTTSTGS